MADKFTQEKRSYIMSKVKSSNTKPEVAIRKFLFANGLRFRINYKLLPGKPDIFVLKYHVAIFFHGCFWHGHQNCQSAQIPKSNNQYWANKIAGNVLRDALAIKKLDEQKIKTIVIWGCEFDNQKKQSERLSKLINEIIGN